MADGSPHSMSIAREGAPGRETARSQSGQAFLRDPPVQRNGLSETRDPKVACEFAGRTLAVILASVVPCSVSTSCCVFSSSAARRPSSAVIPRFGRCRSSARGEGSGPAPLRREPIRNVNTGVVRTGKPVNKMSSSARDRGVGFCSAPRRRDGRWGAGETTSV